MACRILYITSSLPSVTLTFIYREIKVLSEAGYQIETVSLRRPKRSEVSKEALDLYESTCFMTDPSRWRVLLALWFPLAKRPLVWFRGLFTSLTDREARGMRNRFRTLWHLLQAGYLFCRYRDREIEQIHAHFVTGPSTVALFLADLLDVPFSFTMHATLIFTDPILLETKLHRCRRAVTISRYNRDYLWEKYGSHLAGKIEIIRCGVDLDAFHPPPGIRPIQPVILGVGQLAERKGFRYLVKACGLLQERGLAFDCRIVGDGEERNLLREIIEAEGLTESVQLLGRQPQEKVRLLLREAEVFVLPSIVTDWGGREGIPVALMEAMATGIPVVSTKTVGIPELVSHGSEGLLVSQKDPITLAEALARLLQNHEECVAMGARGRKRVAAEFNLSHIPDRFRSVFG